MHHRCIIVLLIETLIGTGFVQADTTHNTSDVFNRQIRYFRVFSTFSCQKCKQSSWLLCRFLLFIMLRRVSNKYICKYVNCNCVIDWHRILLFSCTMHLVHTVQSIQSEFWCKVVMLYTWLTARCTYHHEMICMANNKTCAEIYNEYLNMVIMNR